VYILFTVDHGDGFAPATEDTSHRRVPVLELNVCEACPPHRRCNRRCIHHSTDVAGFPFVDRYQNWVKDSCERRGDAPLGIHSLERRLGSVPPMWGRSTGGSSETICPLHSLQSDGSIWRLGAIVVTVAARERRAQKRKEARACPNGIATCERIRKVVPGEPDVHILLQVCSELPLHSPVSRPGESDAEPEVVSCHTTYYPGSQLASRGWWALATSPWSSRKWERAASVRRADVQRCRRTAAQLRTRRNTCIVHESTGQ